MQGMPPPRYKIVERGRRLITVDVRTGAELGMSALLGADPVFSVARQKSMTAAAAQAEHGGDLMASTPDKRPTPDKASQGRSVSALAVNRVAHNTDPAGGRNAGRWMVVAFLAVLVVILVFSLYLWVPIAMLLWFPATRPLVIGLLKRGVAAARDWVNSG